MEPRIQYAKTSDGVGIAYATFGEGPPIVFPSDIFGSVHLYQHAAAGLDRLFDGLGSLGWSVVAYDGRGTGSSDRDVQDYGLEGRLRDLEAVVDRAAPSGFALCGVAQGGPIAIAYAIRHSDRVTHLVLSSTYARGMDWYVLAPAMRIAGDMLSMAENEWEFYTLSVANAVVDYRDSQRGLRLAEALRAGISARDYVAFVEATKGVDVSELLPQIRLPTLVVVNTTGFLKRFGAVTRRIAPLIPDARLVETDDLARVIDEFLREGQRGPLPVLALPSGTAIILFADIVDSTALTERIGDTAFRDKARGLDEAMRAAIRENGGMAVEGKTLGDGVLAVFTSAKQAIGCAQACHEAAGAAGLALHAGIHAGDVIREADPDGRGNVYGGAVNIAARIAAASAAGETLVSATVRELARTSAGVVFEDRGEQALKGIDDPVRVWAVRQA